MRVAKKKAKSRKPQRKVAATKPAKKIDKAPEIAVRRNVKVNEESKSLFLDHHLPKIAQLKDRVNRAMADYRNGLKTAKKDGFLKRDFEIAFRLKTQMGEKQIKAEVARDLTIAKWLGFSIGKQLDLFAEADDHDIEIQAYADGEEASRTNKPASPIYAPETAGYDAYMRGFHDHQEELAKGIKKLEPEAPSGVAMTRSQFKAQQQAKQKADAAEQRSMFTKRTPEAAAE